MVVLASERSVTITQQGTDSTYGVPNLDDGETLAVVRASIIEDHLVIALLTTNARARVGSSQASRQQNGKWTQPTWKSIPATDLGWIGLTSVDQSMLRLWVSARSGQVSSLDITTNGPGVALTSALSSVTAAPSAAYIAFGVGAKAATAWITPSGDATIDTVHDDGAGPAYRFPNPGETLAGTGIGNEAVFVSVDASGSLMFACAHSDGRVNDWDPTVDIADAVDATLERHGSELTINVVHDEGGASVRSVPWPLEEPARDDAIAGSESDPETVTLPHPTPGSDDTTGPEAPAAAHAAKTEGATEAEPAAERHPIPGEDVFVGEGDGIRATLTGYVLIEREDGPDEKHDEGAHARRELARIWVPRGPAGTGDMTCYVDPQWIRPTPDERPKIDAATYAVSEPIKALFDRVLEFRAVKDALLQKSLRAIFAESITEGFKVYIVGGAVRDVLLGRSLDDINDVDLLGFAPFTRVAGALKRENDSGVGYWLDGGYASAYGVLAPREGDRGHAYFEYAMPKWSYGGGSSTARQPGGGWVLAADLQRDAEFRDLSINSLLYDIDAKTIVDPSGRGIDDLGLRDAVGEGAVLDSSSLGALGRVVKVRPPTLPPEEISPPALPMQNFSRVLKKCVDADKWPDSKHPHFKYDWSGSREWVEESVEVLMTSAQHDGKGAREKLHKGLGSNEATQESIREALIEHRVRARIDTSALDEILHAVLPGTWEKPAHPRQT